MNLRGKVTIILVSHNNSIIEKCDEIYEIKDKKIIKKCIKIITEQLCFYLNSLLLISSLI